MRSQGTGGRFDCRPPVPGSLDDLRRKARGGAPVHEGRRDLLLAVGGLVSAAVRRLEQRIGHRSRSDDEQRQERPDDLFEAHSNPPWAAVCRRYTFRVTIREVYTL